MVDLIKRSRLKPLRDRIGKKADAFLILLSVMSVLLVLINEFVPPGVRVPGVNLSWSDFMHGSRVFTWLAFITVFLGLGLTSHRNIVNYTRKWWLEATIIVVWNPWIMGADLLQHTQSVFSLQTLLTIGIIAHVTRVARWVIREFGDHPLIAVGAAFVTVMSAGSVFVMIVEPGTYSTFQDTLFTVYLTGLTLGGPLVAQTGWGRIAFCIVATAGVSIWAVYNSIIREFVHRFLFKEGELLEKIWSIVDTIATHMNARTKQIDELQQQLKEQGEQLRAQGEQLRLQGEQLAGQSQLMAEMHAVIVRSGGTPPALSDEPAAPLGSVD